MWHLSEFQRSRSSLIHVSCELVNGKRHLAVALLQQQPSGAYGVSIADELKQRTDRTTSVTGVHVVLYRLEEKGLVASELGELPSPGVDAVNAYSP